MSELCLSTKQVLELEISSCGQHTYEVYEGPYIVTPKVIEQTLETNNKFMDYDVTVLEVPYAETSNIYGTTVIIATN